MKDSVDELATLIMGTLKQKETQKMIEHKTAPGIVKDSDDPEDQQQLSNI